MWEEGGGGGGPLSVCLCCLLFRWATVQGNCHRLGCLAFKIMKFNPLISLVGMMSWRTLISSDHISLFSGASSSRNVFRIVCGALPHFEIQLDKLSPLSFFFFFLSIS